jgi:hypothetical protein
MKKTFRHIICIIMAVTMILSLTMIASASYPGHQHPNRPTGFLCFNPVVVTTHTGFGGSITTPHNWQGMNCIISAYAYLHSHRCSSCNALKRSNVLKYCEETHNLCGLKITGNCL